MEYLVNGLLILILGVLYFLAARYLRRKGTCAGCSGCKAHNESSHCQTATSGCDGCCAHCRHQCRGSSQKGSVAVKDRRHN